MMLQYIGEDICEAKSDVDVLKRMLKQLLGGDMSAEKYFRAVFPIPIEISWREITWKVLH